MWFWFQVWLKEIDSQAVNLLIDYAYSGKLDITQANAQNLLATASLLQMTAVKKACAKFMESQLDESNCVGIQSFASVHYCPELQAKVSLLSLFNNIKYQEFFLFSSSPLPPSFFLYIILQFIQYQTYNTLSNCTISLCNIISFKYKLQ